MKRFYILVRNTVLIIACYGYALFRGKARHALVPPKKILIMPASKLGDMVCATPLFRAIKKAYPLAEVVVMGASFYEMLHNDNPDVYDYIPWNESDSLWQSIKKIRRERADGFIVTTPGFSAVATAFLAGIPAIVCPAVQGGFSPYQTRSYRMLFPLVITKPHHMGHYAPREYLRLLEPFSIYESTTKKYIGYPEKIDLRIREFYRSSKIVLGDDLVVGISVSAGNTIKKWANNNFAEVIRMLSKIYKAKIVFVGTAADNHDIQEVIIRLPEGITFVNTAGKFNLEELKALIANMSLFISVDTGPIYIAEAGNVPTIDIVGPMDEREQPPQGPNHRIVAIADRIPQLHMMNARVYDEKEARRQIDEITPDMVIAEVAKIFAPRNEETATE